MIAKQILQQLSHNMMKVTPTKLTRSLQSMCRIGSTLKLQIINFFIVCIVSLIKTRYVVTNTINEYDGSVFKSVSLEAQLDCYCNITDTRGELNVHK